MLRSWTRTAEEEAGRYLHASFEDLLSSAALCGIRELNRIVLRLPALRRRDDMFGSLRGHEQSCHRNSSNRPESGGLVVRKLIYNAESPGKSDSPPKVLALEPINRRKSFFCRTNILKSLRSAKRLNGRSRTIHFGKLLPPRRVCFYCTV